MWRLFGRVSAPGLAAAVLSAGAAQGLLAPSLAETAELSPAQTVAYRFPMNWSAVTGSVRPRDESAAHSVAPPVGAEEQQALAGLMFSAAPSYQLGSGSSAPAAAYGLASVASVPVSLPERANAYAAEASADGATEPHRSAGKSRAEKPSAVAHPFKPNNRVLNDAQIANIKARLRLTPDQQRSWPAVEAALRNITYKRSSSKNSKLATVDPNSSAVQDLKSAAMPLLMSFNDEQKNEVRTLARLMGLEQVAQSF